MHGREIITRRNLPHWYMPGAMHFVTYRLAGTIPQAVLQRLRTTRAAKLRQKVDAGMNVAEHRELAHKQFFAEYDKYLDRHRQIDWLTQPLLAAMIRGNLYHHHEFKYQLLAFCIMPNHVHVLFQPLDVAAGGPLVGPQARPIATMDGTEEKALAATNEIESDEQTDTDSPLATVMHSLKSYTAHEANKVLGRTGEFWQHESYDHWVRDEHELERIVHYIAWNPVRAKLVKEPAHWFFCSAHDRFLQDGSRLGYLHWAS